MRQLTVHYGQARTTCDSGATGLDLSLELPLLSGPKATVIALADAVSEDRDGLLLLRNEDWLAGCLTRDGDDLEEAGRESYEQIFAALQGMKLIRVWQFLPRINEEEGGLERYRRYNRGRHEAFENEFGGAFPVALPAASATGIEGRQFALFFLATRLPISYHENPRQVNAWRYPERFGPKPPGFARGAVCGGGGFLSGTASIIGSETVETESLEGQIRVTCENLRIMMGEMGFDTHASPPHLHVYLRDPSDVAEAQAAFAAHCGGGPVSLRIVKGDICREDLRVEIEAVMGTGLPLEIK